MLTLERKSATKKFGKNQEIPISSKFKKNGKFLCQKRQQARALYVQQFPVRDLSVQNRKSILYVQFHHSDETFCTYRLFFFWGFPQTP